MQTTPLASVVAMASSGLPTSATRWADLSLSFFGSILLSIMIYWVWCKGFTSDRHLLGFLLLGRRWASGSKHRIPGGTFYFQRIFDCLGLGCNLEFEYQFCQQGRVNFVWYSCLGMWDWVRWWWGKNIASFNHSINMFRSLKNSYFYPCRSLWLTLIMAAGGDGGLLGFGRFYRCEVQYWSCLHNSRPNLNRINNQLGVSQDQWKHPAIDLPWKIQHRWGFC